MNAMIDGSQCLTEELLSRLTLGDLSGPELARVEDHVGDCERCSDLLDDSAMDAQWRDRVLPVLREPHEPYHPDGDQEDGHREEAAHESALKLLGPTDEPRSMGRVGPYEVVGIIGRGGMGVVFKALDPALNRYVAIKMLLPHLAAAGAARKRFAREAQAAAAVIDDNVMPIHSVAEWQGVPYLVTPYSRGMTLQKRIQDTGPLELKEILRIGMQVARGLAAAHAQGLVHRDVKPSNILLDGTVERALLTDFGLARAADDASITRTGIIAGTPQYMSPEQASGASVDSRSDLFGLGSVLYAMCTARPPFRADNSYAILRLITDKAPTPIREINPDMPPWLCAIIGKLMAKKVEDRFSSAAEVAALLEKYLAHVQQPTEVPLPVPAARPGLIGRFVSLGKGGLLMLGVLILGVAGVLFAQTEPPDIAGAWNSTEWGAVQLKRVAAGAYEGTFSETLKGEPGAIVIKWSRIEGRFNGTWNEGKGERFGDLSLRLVGEKIQGAYTTAKESRVNPETPKIGDLVWARGAIRPEGTPGAPAAATASSGQTVPANSFGAALAAKKVAMNFERVSWSDVFKWLTSVTDLPVTTTFKPTGTFTFQGKPGTLYTIPEVFDILNEALLANGETQRFILLRRERSFTLVPADEKIDSIFLRQVELNDLENRGKTEIVQVVLPLTSLIADEVAPEVKKLLGPFGEVIPIARANQLILHDSVANLKRIIKLIRDAEDKNIMVPADSLTHQCRFIKAREAERVLKDYLGDPKAQIDPGVGGPINPKYMTLQFSVDERTNTIVVTGPAHQIARAREVLQVIDKGTPAATPASPAHSRPANAPAAPFGGKKVAMSFEKASWTKVFEWLTNVTDLPVMTTFKPSGTFTFLSKPGTSYTIPEVIDIFNEALLAGDETQRFYLIRRERSFTLVPADEKIDGGLLQRTEPSDLEFLPNTEAVSIALPLTNLVASEVAPEVRKLLGPRGEVVPLTRSNHLILQDTVANLKRIVKVIRDIEDNDRKVQVDSVTYQSKFSDVRGMERVLKEMLIGPKGAIDPRIGLPVSTKNGTLKIRADDQTKTIVVTGPADQVAKARQLFQSIDRNLPAHPGEMKTWTIGSLKNISVEDAARTILDVYRDFRRTTGGSSNPGAPPGTAQVDKASLSVGVDAKNKTLTLYCTLEQYEDIRKLIEYLENSAKPPPRPGFVFPGFLVGNANREAPAGNANPKPSAGNANRAEADVYRPQIKVANPDTAFLFVRQLMQLMNLSIDVSLQGNGQFTFHPNPEDDFRWLPRAQSLALVLERPDASQGEAGRRKHREHCLDLIDELLQLAQHQREKGVPAKNKKTWSGVGQVDLAKLIDPELTTESTIVAMAAREDFEAWNSSDGAQTLAPKSDPHLLDKVNAINGLLKPFGIDVGSVDRMVAKGVTAAERSLTGKDGRQRIISLLLILNDAKRPDGKGLPFEEWRNLILARMQVLETIRLVLAKQDEGLSPDGPTDPYAPAPLRRENVNGARAFVGELALLMDFSIDVSIRDNRQFSFQGNVIDQYRWLPRAKSLALVLEQPDPAEGEIGRRKHREHCLELIDELLKNTRHQMYVGLRERTKEGAREFGTIGGYLQLEAREMAKINLEHWNQLDGIDDPLRKNDPRFTDKVDGVKAFLGPFSIDSAAVDQAITNRGGAESQLPYRQKVGLQRLIAQLLVLKNGKRIDGKDLDHFAWKAMILARLEILETLRLVLTRQNEQSIAEANFGAVQELRDNMRKEVAPSPGGAGVSSTTVGSVVGSDAGGQGGYRLQVKNPNWGNYLTFPEALGRVMNLQLEVQDTDGLGLVVKWSPGPRSQERAKSLAWVLIPPDPEDGEVGRKNHREKCLALLNELSNATKELATREWPERCKLAGKHGSVTEIEQWSNAAMGSARSNLDHWNQLDAVQVPPPKDADKISQKVLSIQSFLKPFFVEKAALEQIISKGLAEGQYSFPRNDGRQRLISQLLILLDAKRPAPVDLPLEEWKALVVARLEVLETLRLVLTRENEKAPPAGSQGSAVKPVGGATGAEQAKPRPMATTMENVRLDPLEGVWELRQADSRNETPEESRLYTVILVDGENGPQGNRPVLWVAVYQGRKQCSASVLTTDKEKGQFSMVGPTGETLHGLFALHTDRLQLKYVRQGEPFPKTIDPSQVHGYTDLKRSKSRVAEDLPNELRKHLRKVAWEARLFGAKTSDTKAFDKDQWSANHQFVFGGQVKAFAFSADGKFVAVGLQKTVAGKAGQPSVEILDLATNQSVLALKLPSAEGEKVTGQGAAETKKAYEVSALAFSSDGKTIAVGNTIGQVLLCDARTGVFGIALDRNRPEAKNPPKSETSKPAKLVMEKVASLAFSPDGQTLAAVGSMWETQPAGTEGRSDKALLVSGRVLLWNLKDRTVIRKLDEKVDVSEVAFVKSPEDVSGKGAVLLATLGKWQEGQAKRNGVILWKVDDGSRVRTLANEASGRAAALKFSWEVGTLTDNPENANGASKVRVFSGKEPEVPSSFAFSGDGYFLAASDGHAFDRVHSPGPNLIHLNHAGPGPLWAATNSQGVQIVGFTSDDTAVIALSAGQSLRIIDQASGKLRDQYLLSDIRNGASHWTQGKLSAQRGLIALSGVDGAGRGTLDLLDPTKPTKRSVLSDLSSVGPELFGKWVDESKPENIVTIRMVDQSKTEILITSELGMEEKLTWSPLSGQYEGGGQLTGGELYRIFLKAPDGGEKLSVTWGFDEAWKEKWFKQKAPRYPEISADLQKTLQKEYDEQFQRVWIKMKPGTKTRFNPNEESPW